MEIKEIAKIYTDFPEKFGIPRQGGLVEGLTGQIVFEPEFRNPDAVRGLADFSHLWLLWGFSKSGKKNAAATVAPPRLGGKTRMGVFATRSPYRPNPIGLSSVRLLDVAVDAARGPVLTVSGIDMLNETPIYDIKPYLSYADSHPDAVLGFAASVYGTQLAVAFPEELLAQIAPEDRETVLALLAQDPRDRFIHDEERVWGFYYKNYNIRFVIRQNRLTVREVQLR